MLIGNKRPHDGDGGQDGHTPKSKEVAMNLHRDYKSSGVNSALATLH